VTSAVASEPRAGPDGPSDLALPFIVNSVASVLALIAGLAVSFVAARYLGPAGFGLLGLVQWTRVTGAMLLDVGISSATTRFTAELIAHGRGPISVQLGRTFFWTQSAIGFAAAVTLLLVAPTLAGLLGQPALATYLRIAAITLGLTLINGVLSARLVGQRQFGFKALVDSGTAIASLAGVLLVVVNDWGLAGLVWAEAAIAALQFGALCWTSRDLIATPVFAIPLAMGRRIRRYAMGVFIVTAFDAVIWQRSEVLFLAIFQGADAVGYFTIAYGLSVTVMTLLPHSLGVVLFPSLSERYGLNDRRGLQHLYRVSMLQIAIMTLPLCVGGVVLARDLVRVLYGSQFDPAVDAVRVLFIGATIGALATPGSGLFLALDRAGRRGALAVPVIALNILLAVVLIPSLGVLGAALAKTLTQVVHVSIDATYLAVREGFTIAWSGLGRVACASLAPGLVAFVLSRSLEGFPGLVIEILAGGVAYAAALVFLRAIPREDLDRILSAVRAR
jgi:O-antigen/teichoic acid export membrane protein